MDFLPNLKKSPSRLILILLAVAGVYFAISFTAQIFKSRDMLAQVEAQRTENQALEAGNQRLRDQVAFGNSDAYLQYVERVAREELDMARPDETVILVVPPTPEAGSDTTNPDSSTSPSQADQAAQTEPSKATWQRWGDLFTGALRP
jgi:cell division protein FtsB